MRGYTVEQCLRSLQRKHVRLEERGGVDETYRAIIVKRNSLGIRLWGMVDYLRSEHVMALFFLVIE